MAVVLVDKNNQNFQKKLEKENQQKERARNVPHFTNKSTYLALIGFIYCLFGSITPTQVSFFI